MNKRERKKEIIRDSKELNCAYVFVFQGVWVRNMPSITQSRKKDVRIAPYPLHVELIKTKKIVKKIISNFKNFLIKLKFF